MQIRVRALGCRPRDATKCRAGTTLGVRRAGRGRHGSMRRRRGACSRPLPMSRASLRRPPTRMRRRRQARHRPRRPAHRARAGPRDGERGAGARSSRGRDGASAAKDALADRSRPNRRARKPDAAPKRARAARGVAANSASWKSRRGYGEAHEAARRAEAAATAAPRRDEDAPAHRRACERDQARPARPARPPSLMSGEFGMALGDSAAANGGRRHSHVMPGHDHGPSVLPSKAWMPGTSPAMTSSDEDEPELLRRDALRHLAPIEPVGSGSGLRPSARRAVARWRHPAAGPASPDSAP